LQISVAPGLLEDRADPRDLSPSDREVWVLCA
jgi:hypothetical protein